MDLAALLAGLVVALQWTMFARQQNILTCFRRTLHRG